MTLLQKALNVLELFLHNKAEMSLAEITQLSGMNKATVYRILSEMVEYGYIQQREKRGKYFLGAKFFDFCGYIKSNMKIREVCIPYLVQLVKKTGEASIIAIWDGKKAVITEIFHTNHPLRVVPAEGASIPLHSTAPGKILLANMSKSALEEYLSGVHLEKYTPNTITNKNDLMKHLDIIKNDGVANDYEEEHIGVNSISVAIRDISGEVAGAIGIVGPSARFTRTKMKKSTSILLEYATSISRQLGYEASQNESLKLITY